MKRLSTLLVLFLTVTTIFAQTPNKISYQAVVRNVDDALLSNTSIGMQISILQGSIDGNVVYAEIHSTSTNSNGLISLQIGAGTLAGGNFESIDWSQGPYFVKTETDPEGGSNYSISGTSQLLSVPYALYAETSGSSIPGPQGEQGPKGEQGPAGMDGAAETLTTIRLSNDGSSIDYHDEDGVITNMNLCHIVDNCETETSISFNKITNAIEYIDENGITNSVDIGELISVMADFNDGKIIATHTSGDGTVTNIEETITTLADNGDGTYTYTSEDGSTQTFESSAGAAETLTTIRLSNDGSSIDYLDEDGVITNMNLCQIVDNCETVTSLFFNKITNAIEYIDENGITNSVDIGELVSAMADFNDGKIIATHTSGDGTVTNIEETITTLADNGDGTFTYTSEDGSTQTFDGTGGSQGPKGDKGDQGIPGIDGEDGSANINGLVNYLIKFTDSNTGGVSQIYDDGSNHVGIGTNTPDAQLVVNGYTKLGSSSPAIQIQKFRLETAAMEGGRTQVAHTLDQTKIISVTVLVNGWPPSYNYNSFPGNEYNFAFDDKNIYIDLSPTNSENILNMEAVVTVTVEE